ncbi:MAG TPA: hypothetical protein PK308_00020 [Phycisphaerales bacterium]|nr:hypothetical protein [Phycisphaerales bacterium]
MSEERVDEVNPHQTLAHPDRGTEMKARVALAVLLVLVAPFFGVLVTTALLHWQAWLNPPNGDGAEIVAFVSGFMAAVGCVGGAFRALAAVPQTEGETE